jgi:O-antigen ligase
MTATRRPGADWLALGVTAALPLVAWPGLARPFSTPKLWLLGCASAIVLGLAWRTGLAPSAARGCTRFLRVLPAVWLASWVVPALLGGVVSMEALATAVVTGLWAVALVAARLRPFDLALAGVVGGTSVAAIALLQWIGLDPFAAAGWLPEIRGASVRMRIYATLGNPNFVAALMAATIPLTAGIAAAVESRNARAGAGALLALQILALAATGSRGGALGVVAAGVVWAMASGRARMAVVAAALLAASAIALQSPARPLRQTLNGRVYMWTVIAGQAFAHPWVGHGPGGVAAHYRDWESAARRAGADPTLAGQFGGPQQHAHNDYLEALAERGIPGVMALGLIISAPIGCAVRRARRRHDPILRAAAAAIAAVGAVAFVDFPLARPDELAAFWTALVIAASPSPDAA